MTRYAKIKKIILNNKSKIINLKYPHANLKNNYSAKPDFKEKIF